MHPECGLARGTTPTTLPQAAPALPRLKPEHGTWHHTLFAVVPLKRCGGHTGDFSSPKAPGRALKRLGYASGAKDAYRCIYAGIYIYIYAYMLIYAHMPAQMDRCVFLFLHTTLEFNVHRGRSACKRITSTINSHRCSPGHIESRKLVCPATATTHPRITRPS